MQTHGMENRLRIKSFDLNTRENGPRGLPELCPADGFLIRYEREGKRTTVLLDAGKKGQGEYVILPYLKDNGIGRIDYLMLSHAHNDHFGGMIDILRDPDMAVGQFVYSPIPDDTVKHSDDEENYRFWMELKALLKERVCDIRAIGESETGSRLHIGPDLDFDIVSTPDEQILKTRNIVDLNELNLVWRLNFRRFSALFPGDCGENQARQILNSPHKRLVQSVTLLKAAHHGGDNSASLAFNRECQAKIVLVTCNETVVEHRPSFIRNMHDFSLNGAKLIRMDHFGDVEFTTDGYLLFCHAENGTYKETSQFVL